ncbi:hypothetical protein M9H77_08925 [Catharanthus roseus]|uniref:Uncharacterized protein n=1 Tax=Catharanthus roseus TaxID=4058 RepID=A0ACC0BZ84_CATRO|nr:hypothetical protein M9H77_08925 [Catharanthus roseus]
MLGTVTLDLDPVDRGRSTIGGLGPRRYCQVGSGGAHRLGLSWCMHVFLKILGVVATPMCLDSLRLPVPRGTQVPYSATIDLAEEYGVSQVETAGLSTAKITQMRGTPEIRTYLWFRKMLGPHFPVHETEAVPESSSHGQTNAASHEIIGNFMTKMTKGERAQNSSNGEALERFLRFRPSEFHGEVEQEAKAELFLEQLNDIYDTLQYEGARRVTFTAFRLRGAVKDWWLRISEARVLRN